MASGTNTVILHVKCRDLHQVIQSLTRGQNYGIQKWLPPLRLAMYRVYRKMKEYDVKRIQDAFPEQNDKALHTNKILLFNQIVRYLVDTTPHNGMRDLSNMIAEAKLMRKKSHNAVAMDRITSAIALARNLDAMPELLDALKVRRRLLDSLGIQHKDDAEYTALEEFALKGIEETYRIETLYSNTIRIRILPFQEQTPQVMELEKLVEETPYPKLVRNQIQYRIVCNFVHRHRLRKSNCILEVTEIFNIVESNPRILGDDDIRESYFNALKFLSVSYADEKDFDKALFFSKRMAALAKRWGEGIESNPSLYASLAYTEVWMKVATKDWKAARQLTQKIYKEVVQEGRLDGEASRPSVLRIGALSAYLNKDYVPARNFLRELKNSLVVGNSKYNIHLWAVWTGLVYMLSYLDEEDPYLRTAYKETVRWFSSLRIEGRYETLILDFIKKANEEANPKATTSSLIELEKNLEVIFAEPQMTRYKDMFPILAWIKAKLQGSDIRTLDLD